jgi:PIN domain nuclease of toxin-antitoxin system
VKLLLDTHSFIWFLFGDASLSKKAKSAIEDVKTDCFLSVASLWEISIKQSIGKLNLKKTDAEIEQALIDNQISILPIKIEHTVAIKALPFHHRDPFDRMLIAQALVENCSIITLDSMMSMYSARILW